MGQRLLFLKLFFLLLLSCTEAAGQRRRNSKVFEERNREDSIEGYYVNENLVKTITDTLPLPATALYTGFRDIRLLRYYYDSLFNLIRAEYRNGTNGSYSFYFSDGLLKKARVYSDHPLPDEKFYFAKAENALSPMEIEQKIKQCPESRNFYETFSLGKSFLEKFRSLITRLLNLPLVLH